MCLSHQLQACGVRCRQQAVHTPSHTLHIAGMVLLTLSSHSVSIALVSSLECQRNVPTKNPGECTLTHFLLSLMVTPLDAREVPSGGRSVEVERKVGSGQRGPHY